MERREAREETLKEVQHLIDEAEQRQSKAVQEPNRIRQEVHEKEVSIFISLLKRGFSAQEAMDITNRRDAIAEGT
ncbi:MAG: hypothetical protein LUC83_04525 [Clostridiales bacterium]|nr:hypothetical protein [Clostridiales bacterium]